MNNPVVYCVCEGSSESNLAKGLLAPHLGARGVTLHSVIVATRRDRMAGRQYKGGGNAQHYVNDLRRLYSTHRQNRSVYFTTLIDVYGAPSGLRVNNNAGPQARVQAMEEKLQTMVENVGVPNDRFIPNFMLHEFETLLLVKVEELEHLFLDHETQIKSLAAEIGALGVAVELINETPENAPSKRIGRHLPIYSKQKANEDLIEILKIVGLPALRKACPHFAAWLTSLENLAH